VEQTIQRYARGRSKFRKFTVRRLKMVSKVCIAGVLAVLPVVAVLAIGAPAQADTTDDAYLATLKKAGIVIKDPAIAIAMGKQVCTALDAGARPSRLVQTLMVSASLSPTEGGTVLGVSVAAYCPQYRGLLGPDMP
jgi:hypothetical protein